MAIFILFAPDFNFELEFKKKILSSNQFQINSKDTCIHVFDQSKLCLDDPYSSQTELTVL